MAGSGPSKHIMSPLGAVGARSGGRRDTPWTTTDKMMMGHRGGDQDQEPTGSVPGAHCPLGAAWGWGTVGDQTQHAQNPQGHQVREITLFAPPPPPPHGSHRRVGPRKIPMRSRRGHSGGGCWVVTRPVFALRRSMGPRIALTRPKLPPKCPQDSYRTLQQGRRCSNSG